MTECAFVAEKAYAKVNLFLNVAGRRPDGYHDLEMFNATVSLCDDIRLERRPGADGVRIASNDRFLENGANLITRVAADLLLRHAPGAGLLIAIDKRIPAGAGLGGNSADAAAVIRGFDRLFGLNLPAEERARIALRHGADIPYCLAGGPAFVGGIGERIEPAAIDLSEWDALVVKPDVFTATETVFAVWDEGAYPQVSIRPFRAAVARNDVAGMVAAMHNALEPATFSIAPAVREWKEKLIRELGPSGVVMTGSGSTILKIHHGMTPDITRFIAENRHGCRVFATKFMNKE